MLTKYLDFAKKKVEKIDYKKKLRQMFSAYEIFRFCEKKRLKKLIIKRNFATCLVLTKYLDFAKKKLKKIKHKK